MTTTARKLACLCTLWCAAASVAIAQGVPTISAGGFHTLVSRTDGGAYAWGWNERGNLGAGEVLQSFAPRDIPGVADVAAVAVGQHHVLALTRSGQVYAWGANYSGQLGDGTGRTRPTPGTVPGMSNVVSIGAGYDLSLAVKRDGTVWFWGSDSYSPLMFGGINDVAAVSVGGDFFFTQFILFLKRDGTVWAYGYNGSGQIGDGTMVSPEFPKPVPGLTDVAAIFAGRDSSFAVKRDGTAWSWGDNDFGQLGDGTTVGRTTPAPIAGLSSVTAVAGSSYHFLALRADGGVWSWGFNRSGMLLGRPTADDKPMVPAPVPGIADATAIAAGASHSVVLRRDGRALAWGFNDDGVLGTGDEESRATSTAVAGAGGIASIAAGFAMSYAVAGNGRVSGWGRNRYGSLAAAAIDRSATPIPVVGLANAVQVNAARGYSHAVLGDGSAWAWGENRHGQLGDGTFTDRASPVRLPLPGNVAAISATDLVPLALLRDGTVWRWGLLFGPAPERIPDLDDVIAIAAGDEHGLALKRDGTVWTFGKNFWGQLGRLTGPFEDSPPRPVPGLTGVVAIAAGASNSFAVRSDGTLWGWGANDFGQLGLGTIDTGSFFHPTPSQAVISDVVGVSSSRGLLTGHALAVKRDGTVWAWGYNGGGGLGNGTDVDHSLPRRVPGISNAVAVAAGNYWSVAQLAGGGVLVWGYNGGGIGDGTFAQRFTPQIAVGVGGAGFLDLTPADPPAIPPELEPPFRVVATATGKQDAAKIDLDAQLSFKPEDVGSSGNIYVFALAPANIVKRLENDRDPPIAKTRAAGGAKNTPIPCVLAQLTSTGELQQVTASSVQSYVTGVLSSQGQAVSVLNGVAVARIGGATFYVGYGLSSNAMFAAGNNRSVLTQRSAGECKPQAPQTGWWWNPAEGGRGYSIEVSGGRIFFAAFLYDISGRSTWYVAAGPTALDGALFNGRLWSVANGQTLSGTYRAPDPVADEGALVLAFSDASHGSLVWPGGAIPIERFDIVPNGRSSPPQPNQPESGWWWNPQESGRGFFIEWQNGWADLAGYMYDDAGKPVWYLSVYPTPDPRSFQGNWWSYANGQSMMAPYKPAQRTSDNVAPVIVQFQGPETAIMTLPGGRAIPLSRFRF